METSVFWGFILAISLGVLIGMEREMPTSVKKEWWATGIGGIRSYALIALLGATMAWLDTMMWTDIWKITGFLISSIFAVASYLYAAFWKNRIGVTSEYAAFITYLLGMIVMMGHSILWVILTILLLILLSMKDKISKIRTRISREEFSNSLKFAVISVVALPLLPNAQYSLNDILGAMIGNGFTINHPIFGMDFINPYSIWFFVVIMAGVEYVGYILSKVFGKWGWAVLSGAVGGMISSTAVTAAMTNKSHDNSGNTYAYVAATLIASMIMCIRVIVISGFFNPAILPIITIPTVIILFALGGSAWYFYRKDKALPSTKQFEVEDEEYKSPFELIPAIKFALIIVAVKFIAGIGLIYQDIINPQIFYYVLGLISGLADVDAITMDMAEKSLTWALPVFLAASTILIAALSNNFVKWSIAFRFWEKKFGQSVAIGFGLSTILGIGTIVVMNFFL